MPYDCEWKNYVIDKPIFRFSFDDLIDWYSYELMPETCLVKKGDGTQFYTPDFPDNDPVIATK
jgi:hypothetical protein